MCADHCVGRTPQWRSSTTNTTANQSLGLEDPTCRLDLCSMYPMDTEDVHGLLLPPSHRKLTPQTRTVYLYIRHPANLYDIKNGLKQYHIRIYAVIGLIIVTFVISILTILLSCRPFHHYWQINPDPGNKCQAAVSKPIIWVTFVTNVATDICLLMIPLPMLWKSSLRTIKKVASSIVLSAGVFIIVCAALKSIYVIVVSLPPIRPPPISQPVSDHI